MKILIKLTMWFYSKFGITVMIAHKNKYYGNGSFGLYKEPNLKLKIKSGGRFGIGV